MVPVIEEKRSELASLCENFHVLRLDLFGSAASGEDFDPKASDFDFLVEFLPGQDLGPWLKHYFAFEEELRKLFGRPIDLVMASAARNPYFVREVERTRKLLYAS